MNIQVFTPQAEAFTTQEGAITAEQPRQPPPPVRRQPAIFLTILWFCTT
jgi:hypothetical protein